MLKKLFTLITFCPVFTFSILLAQSAQGDLNIIDVQPTKHVCKLPPTDVNAHFYVRSKPEVLNKIRNKKQATFQVDYFSSCGGDEWPREAISAFEFAVSIWSEHITSDVPIKVNANWIELEGNTLGSARPSRIVQVDGPGIIDNTWYTLAQLSAITGQAVREQLEDIEYDIDMNVQCDFDDWYFGTDANVPDNKSDFVTVVLHEIGHGLGFLGSVEADVETEIAEWGLPDDNRQPLIYDRFTVDGDFNSLINPSVYTNPSADLYDALTGNRGGIFFEGEEANKTLEGQVVDRAKLFSPNPFNEGSSYSHFDQTTFRQSINALMLPFIDRSFAVHTPGPLFCGTLSDMGWPLGGGCLDFIQSPVLIVNQSELNFGVLNSGELSERSILISNSEDAEIALTVTLEIDSDQYSIGGNTNFSIAPGSSEEIIINFAPTIDQRHQATLRINHNAKNVPSPILIQLEGESLESNQVVELDQSYPNPFVVNNSANLDKPIIEFAISEESQVHLDLYSVTGQHLLTILNATLEPRRYKQSIDINGLSSGLYIYQIVVDGVARSGKLIVVR